MRNHKWRCSAEKASNAKKSYASVVVNVPQIDIDESDMTDRTDEGDETDGTDLTEVTELRNDSARRTESAEPGRRRPQHVAGPLERDEAVERDEPAHQVQAAAATPDGGTAGETPSAGSVFTRWALPPMRRRHAAVNSNIMCRNMPPPTSPPLRVRSARHTALAFRRLSSRVDAAARRPSPVAVRRRLAKPCPRSRPHAVTGHSRLEDAARSRHASPSPLARCRSASPNARCRFASPKTLAATAHARGRTQRPLSLGCARTPFVAVRPHVAASHARLFCRQLAATDRAVWLVASTPCCARWPPSAALFRSRSSMQIALDRRCTYTSS
ncbi:hypothetical protein NP493_1176g00020 [Ridgeia piscesae]|uniref:Uncharacterized protein n=1 Tax=Ridgeia piscesae TaxID=27915 RepID=A0AAD9KG09_RIDPI|nr:hypothetical protein NP493_1176g00020 [Ridgeia piscesae]